MLPIVNTVILLWWWPTYFILLLHIAVRPAGQRWAWENIFFHKVRIVHKLVIFFLNKKRLHTLQCFGFSCNFICLIYMYISFQIWCCHTFCWTESSRWKCAETTALLWQQLDWDNCSIWSHGCPWMQEGNFILVLSPESCMGRMSGRII